jgi:hypothetical protein
MKVDQMLQMLVTDAEHAGGPAAWSRARVPSRCQQRASHLYVHLNADGRE